MSYTQVLEDLETLPHYREYRCQNCGYNQKIYALSVNVTCAQCGTCGKSRGYTAVGSEIEDVVDAVLAWLGTGAEFELAMKRKEVIDSNTD